MVSFPVKVIGINPVLRPDGSTAVGVVFGIPLIAPQPKAQEEKNTHTLHINLPGVPPKSPIAENRFVLFLTENEWAALECKPVYGENFVFESSKNGFKITKGGKS